LKQIIISNDLENVSYLLVPNLQATLLVDKKEKPPDQVFRHYYDYKQVFVPPNKIKKCDWDKFDQNDLNMNNKGKILKIIFLFKFTYYLKKK